VLEVGIEWSNDDALFAAWRARVERAGARLRWGDRQTVVRRHAGGASLALSAPVDQVYVATEVNEWALCASLVEGDALRWQSLENDLRVAAREAGDPDNPSAAIAPVLDERAALLRFENLAAAEFRPALRALLDAAATHRLSHLLDESTLTLGAGASGRSYPLDALPPPTEVPWDSVHEIPTALVTGSNGKTTTVRLLAACARANGWATGFNCTDGVFFQEEPLATGDYSGPAGARMVMREPRVTAAILETARGGILRRGIAVSRADTAVVTNVSEDHFGEYGIDDLAGLAAVKLAVAAVVVPDGLLVFNADDAELCAQAGGLQRRYGRAPSFGWFGLDADCAALRDARGRGAPTCGVRAGRLVLSHGTVDHDLGSVAAMPLTAAGAATYNVANLAGAALAAVALGIPAKTIAAVFGRFGHSRGDNPGRMMRFDVAGAHVLLDYAHNPDGLRGLLLVAARLRHAGSRLGLLLGHAGNRKNSDIERLAQVAAEFKPDLVVVKENETQLRGRPPGEIPRIIHTELLRLGIPDAALPVRDSELEAVRCALNWARPGDVLALPVHSAAARAAVIAMLEEHA
jgi:cyanophycin synthetase